MAAKVVMMIRSGPRFFAALAVFLLFGLPSAASAQASLEELRQELAELDEGEAAEIVPDELERAHELLDLAHQESVAGNHDVARALLQLLPLQMRLIRELLRAARLEVEVVGTEVLLVDLEGRRRVERRSLEQVLERLLSLRPVQRGLPR